MISVCSLMWQAVDVWGAECQQSLYSSITDTTVWWPREERRDTTGNTEAKGKSIQACDILRREVKVSIGFSAKDVGVDPESPRAHGPDRLDGATGLKQAQHLSHPRWQKGLRMGEHGQWGRSTWNSTPGFECLSQVGCTGQVTRWIMGPRKMSTSQCLEPLNTSLFMENKDSADVS